MAYKETAPQDTQGSTQGCLHRRLASQPCPVHCGTCWSEGLSSPDRDQQEDLSYRCWHSFKGWKGVLSLSTPSQCCHYPLHHSAVIIHSITVLCLSSLSCDVHGCVEKEHLLVAVSGMAFLLTVNLVLH